MTQPKAANIPAIEKATGKSWPEWLAFMEHIEAQQLTHKDIARAITAQGLADGWWAQAVTVAYEQYVGRRQPGQQSTGDFAVSVSRTVEGSMDEVMERWAAIAGAMAEFNGILIAREPRRTATEKWRHWRCALADGTQTVVNTQDKPGGRGKAILTVTQEKLRGAEACETWRVYWKGFIAQV
ncbi:hypothetical protein JNJ66_06205 [Candidatus Saccharibacteria bacterium]|nr:hypothetical protein [Candidatus Saccharibacteria bacterium]